MKSARTRYPTAMLLLAGASSAFATPAYLIVGDGNQDQHCQYATIQDALDAAAANGPDLDYVFITSTLSYASQQLFVTNQNVLIEGGYTDCELTPPEGTPTPTPVVGDGAHSVFTLVSNDGGFHEIKVHNLDISGGGGDVNSTGGGIAANGNQFTSLQNVRIHDNASGNGGGLAIIQGGTLGRPIFELYADTRIDHNATSGLGGGVYAGGGILRLRADRVSIDHNAAVSGGGVACIGCEMEVGRYGDIVEGVLASGASIANNTASAAAGGILLAGNTAFLGAYELAIDANHAGTAGGGIYAYNGAIITMQRDYPNVFALNCAAGDYCTRLRGNSVGNGAAPTTGGALYLAHAARADLAQVLIADNIAAEGSAVTVDGAAFNAESTLFTHNQSTDPAGFVGTLVRYKYTAPDAPPHGRLAFATFAGNTRLDVNGVTRAAIDIVAQADTVLNVYSSAMYDAVYPITAYSVFATDCIVHATGGLLDGHGTHTRETITGGPGEPPGPGFNDPANGDYRLRSESFLTDYCDAVVYTPTTRDIVLTPRCQDDPRNPDGYGVCDVGAYESDQVFGNGYD
jgi:hypothetical protein